MATEPQHGFSVPELNSEVLLSLGMVTETNALDYHRAFQDISGDSLVAELEASGKIMKTDLEQFSMLIDFNKDRNLFRPTANVVVPAGGGTVEVTVANYTDAGETLSAPAVGLFFLENSSQIEFEVVEVDKSTPGAHTATLKPTRTGVPATTIAVADAEFISIGRPTVQESSFQQDGEYSGWQRQTNYTSIQRTNKQYSDLASMIGIEQRGGRTYYDLDSTDITKQHTDVKEMQLIDGDIRNNVTSEGNRNTQAMGLVALVKEFGTTLDGADATLSEEFFLGLSRAIDGNGYSSSYRGLVGPEAYYLIEDFLRDSQVPQLYINNGDRSDIQVIFDYATNFKLRGIDYEFKKYQYWNSARLAGADVTKSAKAYQMLLLPQGGVQTPEGWRDHVRLRYLDNSIGTDEGLLNKMDWDGALFNRNTTRNGLISVTSYMGIEVTNAEQLIHVQLQNPN